jgi:hypothetical protein
MQFGDPQDWILTLGPNAAQPERLLRISKALHQILAFA